MAALITQAVLLIQCAAALGIYAWLTRGLMMSPGWAAVIAVGIVVLVRFAIVANNFLLAWRHGSETPPAYRLNTLQACRLLLREFCSSMLTWSWTMPFRAFDARLYANSPHPAVLLVHGYGCNSGYWHALSKRLQAERISHRAIELTPTFGGIDDMLPAIERGIEQLCGETGQAKVIVVAHSMGGLAMRAYLCRNGDALVAKLITLGTPHHGTRMARLGIGANSAQMRRLGSGADSCPCDWIEALCKQEPPELRRRVVSIYSHHDNIIVPQTSSELPDARNIAVGGIGHVELGMNRSVHELVVREILTPPT